MSCGGALSGLLVLLIVLPYVLDPVESEHRWPLIVTLATAVVYTAVVAILWLRQRRDGS